MLYTSKRLIFAAPSDLITFADRMPSEYLKLITFVELSAPSLYALQHTGDAVARKELSDWQQSMAALQNMTGLRSLYIVVPNSKLFDGWQHSKDDERRLLEPLRQIRRISTFVVSIAWYDGGGLLDQYDEEAERYSFQVRRFTGHLPGM